jgi:hypothetical protein
VAQNGVNPTGGTLRISQLGSAEMAVQISSALGAAMKDCLSQSSLTFSHVSHIWSAAPEPQGRVLRFPPA